MYSKLVHLALINISSLAYRLALKSFIILEDRSKCFEKMNDIMIGDK